METVDTELDVRDSLLLLARDICLLETGSLTMRGDSAEWEADPNIFTRHIKLENAMVSHRNNKARFEITYAVFKVIDEDIDMVVTKNMPSLNTDPFALDFLDAFKTFPEHPHELCIQAVRHKRAEETRLECERLAGLPPKAEIKITDKRRVARD
jgi:hypothetical protein